MSSHIIVATFKYPWIYVFEECFVSTKREMIKIKWINKWWKVIDIKKCLSRIKINYTKMTIEAWWGWAYVNIIEWMGRKEGMINDYLCKLWNPLLKSPALKERKVCIFFFFFLNFNKCDGRNVICWCMLVIKSYEMKRH